MLRRIIRNVAPAAKRALNDRLSDSRSRPSPTPRDRSRAGVPDASGRVSSYPGDFRGTPVIEYAPDLNGEANCGEIVWTWVPYEEDYSQGKDRPVLIIGRDRSYFLALQLTSKDHDRDAAQEARAGRYWQDIGTGDWDRNGRPSEVRVNRIIRVEPDAVRREGAVLDRAVFERVAVAVRKHAPH